MTTVLIADDDALFLRMLAELLEGAGYGVLAADDGARAWSLLGSSKADLAVLDVNMPGVGGEELLRRIRFDPGLAGLPVLLLTVRGGVRDQVRGYEHGADDYLAKPFDAPVLLARLRVLERRILR